MTIVKRVLLFLAAVCSPTITIAQGVDFREGYSPDAGVEKVTPIGGVIFEQFRYGIVEAYEVEDWIEAKIIFAKVRIPPGGKLVPIGSSAKLKVCYIQNSREIGGDYKRGCAFDDDGDGTFDRIAGNPVQGGKSLEPPVPYHPSEIRLNKVGDDFRKTLTYLGVSGETLRLSYREFVNDMARPAFTEEFTIPIGSSLPAKVSVKDAKFTILGIDGNGLRYTVAPHKQ